MRTLVLALLALPLVAQADPPPGITPSCMQFGTETGYMCSFTRRIDLSWVCVQYGYTACTTAYTDCEVKLIWWETASFTDMDASVSCSAPAFGS